VPRGRVGGGSSALYGGSFLRPTRSDVDGWAAAGGELWSWHRLLPVLRRLEADADFPGSPLHGADGPMPVHRPPSPSGIAAAWAAAATELGFPAEADKNGDGPPGYGPVPLTVAGGVRVNTAMAYLSPRRGAPGLTVAGGVLVHQVLVEDGRAAGVETDAGTVRAGEVVLAAGAVGTPQLLLRSGIGPADELRSAGVDVVADVPGVGRDLGDHPLVYLTWRPAEPEVLPPGTLPLAGVLHTTDLELLPWLSPFGRVTGRPEAGDDLAVGVALMSADSRGRLRLDPTDPGAPPRLEYRYLAGERDRRRLRDGVRLAARLLAAPALAALGAVRTGLPDDVLADDGALDGWIRAHLTTAVHLCGTARMGPADDRGAVVDERLRVRGVEGLRIADTSVLPTAPSRGPAAAAVLIGEHAADLLG
jgi:choline dehydrogenase